MVRCPRCDDEVERLRAVPAELRRDRAVGEGEACQDCLNEMREG